MKYFHRTSVAPDVVRQRATDWFGAHLAPREEGPRRGVFAGSLGTLTLDVRAEGGHYTLVTVATDQPAESEIDRLAKRFLGQMHQLADPAHPLRGAY